MTISLTVNGIAYQIDDSRADDKLIDFLHEELNLTGTKFCCGIGVCRACTVQVSKPPNPAPAPVVSCSTALGSLDGSAVSTIESVARGGVLDPVQQAFLENFSFQCGYCTPGFVMASRMFLEGLKAQPVPADQLEDAMMTAIGSHICRCTGYLRYFEALRPLAEAANAGQGGQQ
ncbi:4-hydroxybenzoyl-CoA reductase subunit gamma [Thalassovita gelatinovora]|uniref:4-hydroxybenzoyl-CoA reductase subunit gamma n=1 Tax=Thalassovita gelatinovora TaxID=53501 RepID=A0A0P1FBA9_THAGE|nr:2Fe-2S iron-sulfur cluster-binding protein [Thalassovita gelatinovora]QIZ80067.1 2Fe-2S iron-sulfur cluster binding domain-containing protein [Thalassovita gelatinovora]CUH65479.1 4-hydroxybenzoyl-CoA reductase subunit gamma [Thalassovita gelatinovora]SER08996.1 Aerobic-type carbon monoxide dehydrogenase, small subunit, CoxS/CutS family [Thalassovita gelatinovora]